MPVYQTSTEDLQKIRGLEQYSFLAENAKIFHGTHWTIALSTNSRNMLAEKLGIDLIFVHQVEHKPVLLSRQDHL